MDAEELKEMSKRNGLYVLHDTRAPEATIAVIVMGATEQQPGRIFNMHIGYELTTQPEGWQEQETTTLVAGPYTLETCKAQEEEMEMLMGEAEFWKSSTHKFRPLVIMCRDLLLAAGEQETACVAQGLIDELALMDEAERKHETIMKGALQHE